MLYLFCMFEFALNELLGFCIYEDKGKTGKNKRKIQHKVFKIFKKK